MKPFLRPMMVTVMALAVNAAYAGSHTWSGASSVYFSNPANWSAGGPPTAGEADVFLYFTPGASQYTCSNNIAGLVVNTISFSGTNYTLKGNSITVTASLVGSGNANAIQTPIVLAGNLTANVSAGRTLYIANPISGSGNFTKIGGGTCTITSLQPNTYSGTTYVNEGTLGLANGSGTPGTVPGSLVVGTALGSPGTAFVKYYSSNQVHDTNTITVNYTGVLDLNGNLQWISGLTMAGGKIETGAGKLSMVGDVNIQPGTATINGTFWLYYSNRTFNASPGGTLNINGELGSYIYNPGFIKTGAGAVNLYGTCTLSGPVLVKQGYLGLGNSRALQGCAGLTVTNIGIVQMLGVGITNVALSLAGNGNGNGALRAFGTNVWQGQINLAANCGIQPLAAADQLTVSGSIYGPGNLTKLGAGKLVFAGPSGNSYVGTTTISQGTLELGTTFGAIHGPLIIGDATNAPDSRVVKLLAPNQISEQSDVTINSSGLLDLTLASDAIGSLSGSGEVYLGWQKLAVGTNGASTTFSGRIYGWLNGVLEKQGSGELFLNGDSPNFFGLTSVSGGILSINGSMANGSVQVNTNGTLAGDGVTGPAAALNGTVTPGNSAGLLSTADLTLAPSTALVIELNGTQMGVDADQVNVTGTVNLNGAILNVQLGFAGAVSNQYLIIQNDSSDAVNGTFNGLPEGGTFFAHGAQFQITYKGGTGNDVVLTQIGIPEPSTISGITKAQNGQIQIQGNGAPGSVYGVEANADLGTTNWITIGAVIGDQSGHISFTDTNAANFPMRFYRLKTK